MRQRSKLEHCSGGHVESKDNLITLAGDAVWSEIDLPDFHVVDWRSSVTMMAKDLYAMIIRHPWLVSAMSTHLIYGPGKARRPFWTG